MVAILIISDHQSGEVLVCSSTAKPLSFFKERLEYKVRMPCAGRLMTWQERALNSCEMLLLIVAACRGLGFWQTARSTGWAVLVYRWM
jgi:hypothetical protein